MENVMTDFSPIEEEFNEAVEIRKELNSVHWKDYEALKVIFGLMFSEEPSLLKFISDINYYEGGYPGPDSPAKIDALLWKVGDLARFYDLVGRLDEVNASLLASGYKIVPVEGVVKAPVMTTKDIDATKKGAKAMDRAVKRFNFSFKPTEREQVEWFLKQTKALQGVICSMADEIKIRLFEQVDAKMDKAIDKSGFNTAVNMVAKRQLRKDEKKDENPVVEKALEKSEILATNGEFLRETVTRGD